MTKGVGELDTVSVEEIAHMVLLRADLSARNRRRIYRASTALPNVVEPRTRDIYHHIVDMLEELHTIVGFDTPLFSQLGEITTSVRARELFQRCYDTAKGYAIKERERGISA